MWSAIFPGQGSQHPGMGKFLYEDFVAAKRLFEEASDTLSLNMRKLCFDGSESDLAQTENTQPCMLLVSTAAFTVLAQEFGFTPRVASGHSVGEFSAIVAAKALSFSDALRAVRQRGQAMQSAVPLGEGGMTAVMGLDFRQVSELCVWAEKTTGKSPVQPANINAPGQIVISGKKSILNWLAQEFKPEMLPGLPRARFVALKVSAPFHCAMMKPAEEAMASVLAAIPFATAAFPVVQNVNAQAVQSGDDLRRGLVQQVVAPVRWVECMSKIGAMGSHLTVEVGCGKVLSGLAKKIDRERLRTFNVNSLEEIKQLATAIVKETHDHSQG